jgi:phosphoribosylformylglycinamidine cyclo-ligase
MSTTPESQRTFGLRVVPGGSDLVARVSLDFEQKLFRRNYRRPVLISTSVLPEPGELQRWLKAASAKLLGFDVAARTLNRVAAEAAEPLFLRGAIRGGTAELREQVCEGFAAACLAADCAFLDDLPEDDDYGDLWIAAFATGVVDRSRMMDYRRADPDDAVLAIGGDRLWPDLVEPARKVLAMFKPDKNLPGLDYSAAEALLRPVPVLAGELQEMLRRYTVKRVVHAMEPVEGDGLVRALERMLAGEFLVKPVPRTRQAFSGLLHLLGESGLATEGFDDGHRRGIVLLMVVSRPFANAIASRLRRLGVAAYQFGRLVRSGEE